MSQEKSRRDGVSGYGLHQSRLNALLQKQIFFIGGASKSGTTWLQLLLDAHPQVSCSGECHVVTHLATELRQVLDAHNQFLLDKQKKVFAEIGRRLLLFEYADLEYLLATSMLLLLSKAPKAGTALAIGEKTPENIQAFEALARIFPTARCIQIVRDPRDAAVSGWFHVNRITPAAAREQFNAMYDYVKFYTDAWVAHVGLALKFGEDNPELYAELIYEDLIEGPEATLARLFRFLGVDDSAEIVRSCVAAAAFERLSGGRARGRENPTSLFRKGIVGDWKNHFDDASNRYVLEKAGPLMRRFGFIRP